ncbi:unnamed protein product [Clonostachys rhizophaga]|uniref:Uncharacterized protein n=1 Tax=Clonostachys rhizophaga TaxID=160324 RepID=A0A9N9VY87_9HYPO|nr:unnamed protein product [Clonostachys rhizophaga]
MKHGLWSTTGEKATVASAAEESTSGEEIKMQLVLVKLPTPPRAIILPSWKHTTVCFEDAFGDLPQFSMLWSDAMVVLALSQHDHGVSRVIELAGEVHMIRASGPFELERQRTRLWNLAEK